MAKITIDGVDINYRSIGAGSDVVLIHGLAANQAFWHPLVVKMLAERYRLTLYDLRGHGYSSMPRSGYTSADMAGDLEQLLDRWKIGSANLVGHSFGGLIALHCALRRPDLVKSLVLADVRVRALQPTQRAEDWPRRDETIRKLEQYGLAIPQDENEAGLWVLEQLAAPELQDVREKFREGKIFSILGKSKRSPGQWLKVLQETTAKVDIVAPADPTVKAISSITQPTLGMYGEHSPSGPTLERLRSTVPDFQEVIIPGGGHFFPMGRPKLFAQCITRFLDQVERRNGEAGHFQAQRVDSDESLTTVGGSVK